MTREEAIKFLTLMRKAVSNFEEYGHDKASMVIECDKAEAIDMAIESLSAKPQTDLISRADAIDALYRSSVYSWSVEQDQSAHTWELNIIAELPSADAVHKPDYSYEAGMVRRLKEAQSAEPSDLISRADAIEHLKNVKVSYPHADISLPIDLAIKAIEILPSADAVQGDECDHCVYKWGMKGGDTE